MGSWVYYRMQPYVSSEHLNLGLHACTVACALPMDSLLLFYLFLILQLESQSFPSADWIGALTSDCPVAGTAHRFTYPCHLA